ncbi:MAG: Rpn family recombination-promoting nuclease/putative transposase [Roseburia sp.]|nr:Rpn family recombination-promoting nuclease/putative transposase [Roseburia sp.]
MQHIIKVVKPLGVKDTVTTKYMRQNEIFADAFNYFVYGGEQVISPESLEELDTREIDVPYGGEKGAKQPVQKTRDVIKSVIAMMDKRTAYLLLAVENQSNIHYAMPVKNMVYDALQYAKQVEAAIASHKMSGDYKGVDSDEYLSGFMKADCLLPVITLVIYFDSKKWDGPLSIHEMFAGQDARVLAFVPDYKINLIAPAAIEDSEFEKFQTTLKEVLSFIKYSSNADKLQEVIGIDKKFRHLGRTEVDVLNACVNANLTMKKDEEVLDVCQAIQTIADRAAEQKRMDTLLDNVKKLMEKMGWSAEQSMDVLSIPESDRNSLAQRLK